jgi:type I restriction enzyme S subunit
MKSSIGDTLYVKGRIGWKGLKKTEYLKHGTYRIINGSNILDSKISWDKCGYISKERYEESPEIQLRKDDILVTKDGTIGKTAMVGELSKPTSIASGLFLLRNTLPEKWNSRYLFYFLQSKSFSNFIKSRREGSVIPHLYQKDFEQLELPDISKEEQNRIVYILDTLTDKIENNNDINDNLVA